MLSTLFVLDNSVYKLVRRIQLNLHITAYGYQTDLLKVDARVGLVNRFEATFTIGLHATVNW